MCGLLLTCSALRPKNTNIMIPRISPTGTLLLSASGTCIGRVQGTRYGYQCFWLHEGAHLLSSEQRDAWVNCEPHSHLADDDADGYTDDSHDAE